MLKTVAKHLSDLCWSMISSLLIVSFILLLFALQLYWKLRKSYKAYSKANGKIVWVEKAEKKDEVQKDARNEANPFIRKWWKAKTSIEDGIEKTLRGDEKDY